MPRALGIDLGTTNSVMAYIFKGEPKVIDNRESKPLTPSVVGRGRKGELLVGQPAKNRAVSSPEETVYSVKRFIGRYYNDDFVKKALAKVAYRVSAAEDGNVAVWIGERTYSPTEISALVLRRMKEDAERVTGQTFSQAVITVPAYFGERQVDATREAGRLAGFSVLKIINEPTAAALAFGFNRENIDDSKTILVYDLGGGTFDISIMSLVSGSLNILGTEGDNLLGGDDFDNLIMEKILVEAQREYGVDLRSDRRAMQTIRQKAEEAKIGLSAQTSVEISAPALGSSGIDLELELTRDEFESMICGYIDRTIELTHKAIRDAYLTPDEIDYILLVGGSTMIPMVEHKLAQIFGKQKIRKDVNPMECVAIGAAIQTVLVTEVECSACHAQNAIQNDYCFQCKADLAEQQLAMCPTCFGFMPVGETTCYRCTQGVKSPPPKPVRPVAPPVEPRPTVCPKCGKPYAPGQTRCTICDREDFESGLKCPACGVVNAPGAITCRNCNADMPVTEPTDITAKDLGIALVDGRMAVIIPKGHTFPIETPITKEFYTAVPGQVRLEIEVYEGPEPVAANNEMIGLLTMALPEGLPKGTGVNIGFGLDKNRTITIVVKLRSGSGQVKNAVLHHGLIDPELRKKVMEERLKLVQFIDKWNEELTEAERADFADTLASLDMAINEDASHLRISVETLLQQVSYKTDLAKTARGANAFNSAVLRAGGKYISEELRHELELIDKEFDAVRAMADWNGLEEVLRKANEASEKMSGPLKLIVYCRTFADQNKITPALQQRVYALLRKLDEAVERGDRQQIDECINALYPIWDEIQQELDRNTDIPVVTKVVD